MEIDTIRRMAKRGTLEVEHLLRLAKTPSAELATAVDGLANEMGWEAGATLPTTPFGDWAAVVGRFCRSGFDGLVVYANDARKFEFVIGLLEELGGVESLHCLEGMLKTHGPMISGDPARSKKLTDAFNRVGQTTATHGGYPAAENIESVRVFLHAQLSSSQQEAARGVAMCALRYFGDRQSLDLVRSAPQMADHWEPARTAAIRGIRKRLRQAMQTT